VLQKNTRVLAALLTLGSLSVAVPAIAEPTTEQFNNPFSGNLLSQLLGHETYEEGGEQLQLSDYTLGRVRGKAGNIMSVELMDMSGDQIQGGAGRVIMKGEANPGSDVLLTEEDGNYELVGAAHPAWITTLQEDYKWKMSAENKGTPLAERTAQYWQALEQNAGRSVTISPLEPQQPAVSNEVPPQPEPVRGMW
jgi:hypothetical protein